MRISLFLATSVLVATAALPALSAEIGRVELDGSQIILHDDQTWEYAGERAAAPDGCTVIASETVPVSLCLDPDKWALANLDGAEEHGFRHKEHEIYVLLISETEVIDMATLKKAVLTNAQTAAGLSKVLTLEDGTASVDGHLFGRIVYRTTVDGIDVTYANYYTSFKSYGSLQIVAFAGTETFDSVRPVVAEVIAGVKIMK